jgi:hypothetical protein
MSALDHIVAHVARARDYAEALKCKDRPGQKKSAKKRRK